MVLAALGADHWKVVSIAERLLSDLPNAVHPEEPKSVYVGGEYRCQAESLVRYFSLILKIYLSRPITSIHGLHCFLTEVSVFDLRMHMWPLLLKSLVVGGKREGSLDSASSSGCIIIYSFSHE